MSGEPAGRVEAQATGQARQANLGQGWQLVDQSTNVHLPPGVLHAPGTVAAPSALSNLPGGAAEVFVGRDEALATLERELQADRSRVVIGQVIHGIGGVGKTELARQYALARAERYRVRWWIVADGADQIQNGLAMLAERLHPPLPRQSALTTVLGVEQAAAWAYGWLQAHQDWLLVLDNVEDPRDVRDLLGQLRTGHILLTTRRDVAWPDGVRPVPLNVLGPDAAIDLLAQTSRCPEPADRPAIAAIAQELGRLPLALEQAGAYLREARISPKAYLELLSRHPAHLYAAVPEGGDAGRAIARLWNSHLGTIRDRNPHAEHLLRVLACYAPDNIPRDLIDADWADRDAGVPNPATLDALRLLVSYGLISLDRHTISMHRLLQAVLTTPAPAASADLPSGEAVVQVALAWLAAAWPHTTSEPPTVDQLGRRRLLSPHIAALTSHHQIVTTRGEHDWVFRQAVVHEYEQGNYQRALTLVTHDYAINQASLGEEHPDTLTSRGNLATVLRDLGRLEEAEAEARAVWQVQVRVLGEEHPDTLASRNNLALALQRLGRLGEAEAEARAVWQVQARVLGEEHPLTLSSRNNLALVLHGLGRLGEAEAHSRAVWQVQVRVLGEEHPLTLTSRNNLALALQSLGRLEEAEAEARAVWQVRARVLGEEHPDTLTSRGNFATVLRDLGRLGEAEAEARVVWQVQARVLGEEHPDTLTSRGNFATVLLGLGRLEDAEAHSHVVWRSMVQVVGEEHPDTLASRSHLALALQRLGRLEDAEAHNRAVWRSMVRLLGEEHPDTLASRANLAAVLLGLGRLGEAEAEARVVWQVQARVLGEEHPYTLASRSHLALVLQMLGRLEDAEAHNRAVWRSTVRVLGKEHPNTLTSRANLAAVLRDLGRLEEAEAEARAVWQVQARVLGEEHPDTLASHVRLALVLLGLARWREAEAEMRAVWQVQARVLGEEHPDTLTSRGNLAAALGGLGRLEEAEAEGRAVWQSLVRVLGAEHPNTRASRQNLDNVIHARRNRSAESAQARNHGVSRNALCPCGSGRKFKRCHGVGAAS
ncbi:FxSxx-COOH system tetratricopeptide repeat protein [Nonomuraea bangladeshensis]|uniref:FxSxx-COOH system tetratricopeptide repeat protein n=1 Tax=Nonomuraea bangladeshensis TaxID=404385 RepID=UPI0031CE4112